VPRAQVGEQFRCSHRQDEQPYQSTLAIGLQPPQRKAKPGRATILRLRPRIGAGRTNQPWRSAVRQAAEKVSPIVDKQPARHRLISPLRASCSARFAVARLTIIPTTTTITHPTTLYQRKLIFVVLATTATAPIPASSPTKAPSADWPRLGHRWQGRRRRAATIEI
jgi:hypothetical protein